MDKRMLRSFTLKVDMFAGTDIREAACDLCELADRIGCLCEAEFNGVKLCARPGNNPLKLVDSYNQMLGSKHTVKIAQA